MSAHLPRFAQPRNRQKIAQVASLGHKAGKKNLFGVHAQVSYFYHVQKTHDSILANKSKHVDFYESPQLLFFLLPHVGPMAVWVLVLGHVCVCV